MRRQTTLAATIFLASPINASYSLPSSSPRLAIPPYKRQDNFTTPITTNETYATWADINPSPDLNWVDCEAPNLQCAYLSVPLDYADPSVGTTDIAFQRYLVSEELEDIVFNPGGPGVSGVDFVPQIGSEWSKKWGYNIVSFDPRGVKRSGPKLSCELLSSSGNDAAVTEPIRRRRRQAANLSTTLRKVWDTQLKENQACSEANKHSHAKYVGTSAVVQDILHFVELQAPLRNQNPSRSKINYYGISYGTGIGQTLVAMYPDRIRRVLLDGNVYAVAHYQGWEPNGIDDLPHAIWMFNKLCFEAGEEWCGLAEGMTSIEETQQRFDDILAKLDQEPLEIGEGVEGKLDAAAFVAFVSRNMMAPRETFKIVANATVAAEHGDVATLAELMNLGGTEGAQEVDGEGNTDEYDADVALKIITAVDMAGRYPWRTFEEYEAASLRLEETAKYGGLAYAAGNGLIGLSMTSFIPPDSQLVTPDIISQPKAPSTPILFVNTPGDPVTPMSSMHQMSVLFEGSSWFVHNAPGHGISVAPSKCTDEILEKYWRQGEVPESGTWCEVDVDAEWWFGAEEGDREKDVEVKVEDVDLHVNVEDMVKGEGGNKGEKEKDEDVEMKLDVEGGEGEKEE